MRLNGELDFEDVDLGLSDYKTSDGRILRLDPEIDCIAEYEWTLSLLSDSDEEEFPEDCIRCHIFLPDEDGNVWEGIAQTSSEYLIQELAFANFDNSRNYGLFDQSPKDFQSEFDSSKLLSNVRFSSDDRFYRSFRIGDQWVQAIFKYSELRFDIAFIENDFETKLYARLNEGCAFDGSRALNEISHTDELPALFFELGDAPMSLIYHARSFNKELTLLGDPLPNVLKFVKTDEVTDAQEAVRILND